MQDQDVGPRLRDRRRRIVIVDDNEITRAGCSQLLAAHPKIQVVAALDHPEAQAWTAEWDSIDVALVDAAAERSEGDQFPGVGVVRAIRRYRTPDQTVVVILTGHYLDEAVRRRMHEVDADFFYSRTEAMNRTELADVILNPDASRRTVPTTSAEAAALGLTSRSRVDDFVHWVHDSGLESVFTHGAAMKQGPHPTRSRWWTQLRRDASRISRIQPVNSDGNPPRREQDSPSVSQLRRLYTWATKIKNDDQAPSAGLGTDG